MLVFGGFARQQQAERGVVIHNYAPVAVQNAPARPRNGHRFDAVLLRPLAVEFGILHLQPPESGNQEQEDDHRGVLEDGNLPRRKPRIVAQRWFIGKLLPGIRVGRRKGHNEAGLCSSPILTDSDRKPYKSFFPYSSKWHKALPCASERSSDLDFRHSLPKSAVSPVCPRFPSKSRTRALAS